MDTAPLWSFAVISDTHVEAVPDAVSNLQLADVVTALKRHQPDFVLHLGDIVHPLPDHATADAARANARQLLAGLTCPIWFTPGNHDIGDKPLQGMPAVSVTAGWREEWVARHGPDFTWFNHAGWRVVLLNAPVLNSDAQTITELEGFLAQVAALPEQKPILIGTHYPLFLETVSEPGNYDNIDDPARRMLLDFCKESGVRVVLTGHIHSYLFREVEGTRFHGAPAVSFARRDFTEIANVAPFAEFGRRNPSKTGFLWVDIYEKDLSVRMIETAEVSRFSETGEMPGAARPSERLPIGVNLRHDWARVIDLPFNPPVAAFQRRRYRDDDTFRALVELGLRDLRIPAADLLDHDKCLRLTEMQRLGFRFCTFLQGLPSDDLLCAMKRYGGSLDAVEIICAPSDLKASIAGLKGLETCHDLALSFAPLLGPDSNDSRTKFKLRFGFDDADSPAVAEANATLKEFSDKAGLVFSIAMADFHEGQAARLTRVATERDFEAVVLLERLADDTVALGDDDDYPQGVARVLSLAQDNLRLRLFLDTLVTFDRGYHARSGLVDRRMTPTPAGRILRNANMITRRFPNR